MSERRYRFGPLEQRALIGPLRAGQTLILAVGGLLGLAALYLLGNWVGMALAIAFLALGAATVSVPIEGRSLDRWAPLVLRFALRPKRRSYRSARPTLGIGGAGERLASQAPALPEELSDLELIAVPYGSGEVGVICERRAGTYTAALSVRAGAFGLRERAEQERALEAWGSVLASLARDGSPISRLQWTQRTMPARSDELAAHLQADRDQDLALKSGAVSSYIELIESAAPSSREHEVLIALQISERRAARELRRLGGGCASACEVLLREAEGLAERLSLAEVSLAGLLSPARYTEAIRDAFDPFGRQRRSRAQLGDQPEGPTELAEAGPLAAEAGWNHYRSDSSVHRTYWIRGWPKMDVGPLFLAPLMMASGVLRSVSVTIEPIPHALAMRRAEAARTAEIAEEMARERQGYLTTARVRRRQQAAARREEELADGHAQMRIAGFVVHSAPSIERLEREAPDVEHAAGLARLELEPLYGEQAEGFCFGLPLGRGLR